MNRLRKPGGLLAALPVFAVALLLMLPAAPAGAHAGYARSEPADGAVLAVSPPQVDVYFSQEMARKSGLPSLLVVNDIGDTVDLGGKLDDNDRKHLFAPLAPELPDGRYTVIWHTLSDEDGEEAQGAFHFFIGAAPNGTTGATAATTTRPAVQTPRATVQPSPAATASDSGGGDIPVWGLVVGIVAGAGAGGGAGLALGRRLGRG